MKKKFNMCEQEKKTAYILHRIINSLIFIFLQNYIIVYAYLDLFFFLNSIHVLKISEQKEEEEEEESN